MSTAAVTPSPRRRAIVAVALSVVAGSALGGTIGWTGADASPGESRAPTAQSFGQHRPVPSRTLSPRPRPVPHRPAPTCATQTYGSQTYCIGTLEGVITRRYGVDRPIAMLFLQVTSVTSADGRTVVTVVDPDPQTPTSTCTPAPGVFCGARAVPQELAIVWPLGDVPPAPSYIQLYGITSAASIVPDGFTLLSCIAGCDG